MRLHIFILVLFGTLGLSGCKADKGERCAKDGDCGKPLLCHSYKFICIEPRDVMNCRSSDRCWKFGECHYLEGECVVSDQSCQASACRSNGMFDCEVVNGKCVAKPEPFEGYYPRK